MFHFHKWSDWSITERGKVVDYYRGNVTVGTYLIQSRHCLSCLKVQTNRQSTPRFMQPNHHLISTGTKVVVKHDKVS